MRKSGLMRRSVLAAVLLVCIGVQPALAARRRGATLYPDKETTADMSGAKRVFIGWVDFNEDNWTLAGQDKAYWVSTIKTLNAQLLGLCQTKLPGKAVDGAKGKGDENAAGYDLYVRLSDVMIDYNNYHLNLSIHFIDPNTNTEIGSIPARPYFGNDWGFVNYLKAALDEVSQKIKVEVTGETPQKKGKIPLIHKL